MAWRRLEMRENFNRAAGRRFSRRRRPIRAFGQRAAVKYAVDMVKLRLNPFKGEFAPDERKAHHPGVGGDFAAAFRQLGSTS